MVSQIVVSLVKCLRGDRILYGTKTDRCIWVNDVYCNTKHSFEQVVRICAHCRSLFLTNYENPRSSFYVRFLYFNYSFKFRLLSSIS